MASFWPEVCYRLNTSGTNACTTAAAMRIGDGTCISNLPSHGCKHATPSGVFLGAQLLSGFLLACGYLPDPAFAFDSVQALVRTLPGMWLLRFLHVNGATTAFVLMSCHWAKAFAVHSYAYPREHVWWTGCAIVALLMLAAFTGYVLVWGQISYWALTVITNLATAIPLIGFDLLTALWGGEVLNA